MLNACADANPIPFAVPGFDDGRVLCAAIVNPGPTPTGTAYGGIDRLDAILANGT